MPSHDDLALLKTMYERGEITDEQYDVLRRHVLWGTPLPALVDQPPAAPAPVPRTPAAGPRLPAHRAPDPPSSDPGPSGPPPVPGRRPAPGAPAAPTAGSPAAAAHGAAAAYGAADAARGAGPAHGTGGGRAAGPGQRGGPARGVPPAPGSGQARGPDQTRGTEPAGRSSSGLSGPSFVRGRAARRGPRLAAVITSLVLAAALAGTGVWWFALRPHGLEPTIFARSVCIDVRNWQQALDGSTAKATSAAAAQRDAATVRADVRAYFVDLAGRTDALHATLIELGPPDAVDGPAYADGVATAVASQAGEFRTAAARAGQLDPSRPVPFRISVQTLLASTDTIVSRVRHALSGPGLGPSAPLRATLSAQPDCAAYVG